jgi:hypothetical protein
VPGDDELRRVAAQHVEQRRQAGPVRGRRVVDERELVRGQVVADDEEPFRSHPVREAAIGVAGQCERLDGERADFGRVPGLEHAVDARLAGVLEAMLVALCLDGASGASARHLGGCERSHRHLGVGEGADAAGVVRVHVRDEDRLHRSAELGRASADPRDLVGRDAGIDHDGTRIVDEQDSGRLPEPTFQPLPPDAHRSSFP